MSADVWIKQPEDAIPYDEELASLNITYNLSGMLHDAGFCGWRELVGMPACDAGKHVLAVLDYMREDDEGWRAMNPANGWGDYDDCLQGRMRKWAEVCVKADAADTIGGWL